MIGRQFSYAVQWEAAAQHILQESPYEIVPSYLARARVSALKEKYDDAIQDLTKVVDLNVQDSKPYYLRGDRPCGQGRSGGCRPRF
jgi:hypothetical protein